MKSAALVLSLGIGVIGLGPTTSYAAEGPIYRVGDAIYDTREMEEKSTIQESLNPSEKLTKATVHSKVSRFLIPPLVSATATSSATMKQDKIVAKARAYNDRGGLIGTKTDTGKKSAYAGATVNTGTIYIKKAIGNHSYEKAGYVPIYHETVAQ